MKMKNSGIEWIGEIPDEWNLINVGSLFQCRNEKVSDKEYAPLSVSKGGVVPQIDTVAKTDAGDNRKLVKKNDFVINSRSDRKQSCGYSDLEGSVSLINTVFYVANENIILPQYTTFLLKNYGFAEEFYRWGHGIVADLWTTRWQEMKSIVLPIPSIQKQTEIILELDKKCAAVDRLIENQSKQIEKLKEYKQSVITEAVTKGLNPSVPMKDSGLKIGVIPTHWRIIQFKFVAKLSNGKEVISDSGDIPVYGSGGVFKYTNDYLFNGVSLLMGRKGTIDNPMLVNGKFWTVDTMFYTSEIKRILPKFLYYLAIGVVDYGYYKSGSVLPSMTQTEINNIRLTYPPIDEQRQIADYLDKKCEKIDRLIALKQQKIEKLNEYKKSLIYEYVTGKKEVI